jgi:rhamnose transport system ATP-binding protein
VTALLHATSISKSFDGLQALRDVSFELAAGEVHALVGENGAGKSTLIKIIAGAEQPDSGTLTIAGRTVQGLTPVVARSLGVATIYQQPSLFPQLSVAENIGLALEPRGRFARIKWDERRRRARELLARIGADLDPGRLIETLAMPEQQLVEIAKAIGARARILVMDEPTSSLSDHEVERLVDIIDHLRADGVGIIYISHRFDEVFRVADRVTVLRDGERVITCERRGLDRAALVRAMVGRDLAAIYPTREVNAGPVALELRHISSLASDLKDVSLTVSRGEILGLAGLVGSGRTELAETVFGLRSADAGVILVDGVEVEIRSPLEAIAHGIGYVPEDRRQHGVVMPMSVAANVTLASLSSVARRGIVDETAERRVAASYVDRLAIKTRSVDAEVSSLSGGNQQKVALARWLATRPSILILDEPTQGVDVGAKAEIHAIMSRLAEQGTAILMISSELPEILGMSDRVAVMHRGRLAGIVSRADATAEKVLTMALA